MRTKVQILLVCRANLCRSPMAERLTLQLLSDRGVLDVAVHSAGVHGRDGMPMHPYAKEALRWNGLLDGDFRSRRLRAGMITDADLVLTASRAHRAECARLAPAAVRYTFTMFQFARLAAATPRAVLGGIEPAERLGQMIKAVPQVRALTPPYTLADEDLQDPVNGPVTGFRHCADQIQQAMERITALIAPR
ncbi:low molecular weight phosphatase family protein [Pilimelia columellifera]|uniref:protein-tyrosine-phosphatase n=1 Tax=Pilimelia columellifera subsp. columellifera TaxID=706583 RepID=A0ABN3MZ32_9ACTN